MPTIATSPVSNGLEDEPTLDVSCATFVLPLVQATYIAQRQVTVMWRSQVVRTETVVAMIMGVILGTLFFQVGHTVSLPAQSAALAFLGAFLGVSAMATMPYFVSQRQLFQQGNQPTSLEPIASGRFGLTGFAGL
jgi:hypothetical protein